MVTIRVLLTVSIAKGCHLHHMNVKNMFLQGELQEHVYMVQPLGFHSGVNASLIEEVVVQTQASPTCLECEHYAGIA